MLRLVICVLAIVLIEGCTKIDSLVSPGRIERADLKGSRVNMEGLCEKMASCKKNELEVIAHVAGSYREYPMTVDRGFLPKDGMVMSQGWGIKSWFKAKDINDLIDKTFENSEIDSLEIDIQVPPSDHPLCTKGKRCAFVVHDLVDWSAVDNKNNAANIYLKRNSLDKILTHFVKEKSYYKNRRLYLELKSLFTCNAPKRKSKECSDLGKRIAKEISMVLPDLKNIKSDNNKNWLTLTSFSASALEEAHTSLKILGLDEFVDFALIAGVYPNNSFLSFAKWVVGQQKGSVPMFTKPLRKFAVEKTWLDSIWFSPQGVTNFYSLFHKMNKSREDEGLGPLKFSVANYSIKWPKFKKAMLRQPACATKVPIVAMMIDIDDDQELKKQE